MLDLLERKIGRGNALRKTFVAGMIYARNILNEENPSEVKSLVSKNILSHLPEKISTINDEVIYLLEPRKIEGNVLESDGIALDL